MKTFFQKYFAVIAPLLFVVLVLIDQWTKGLAVAYLKGQEAFPVWKGVLEFQYFENTGAAWGMLKGKQVFFYVLTVVFCAAVLYEIKRLCKEARFLPFVYTLVLMLAGAVGNFIDRVCQQYVVDFIYVKIIDFPIFNVADSYITVSVVIMMVLLLFCYTEEDFDRILPFLADKKQKEQ